jgi:hypothetical protein
MGSASARPPGRRPPRRPGREGRRARRPAVPALPGRGVPRRAARHRARIAVLDRTKEPGATGEPLFQDVVTVLADAVMTGARDRAARRRRRPLRAVQQGVHPGDGRRGVRELAADDPKRRFTVGIVDDVTHLSLDVDRSFALPRRTATWRRSSTGSAPTAPSVRQQEHHQDRLAEGTGRTSRPTSSTTRRSPARSPPRTCGLRRADRLDLPDRAGRRRRLPPVRAAREARRPARDQASGRHGAAQRALPAEEVWDRLPADVQQTMIDRDLAVHVIDAYGIAREVGSAGASTPSCRSPSSSVTGVLPPTRRSRRSRTRSARPTAELGEKVVTATSTRSTRRGRAVRSRSRAGHLDRLHRPDPIERALELPRSTSATCRTSSSGSPPAARRRGRAAAGLRPAGRRDVPDRDGPVGEALDRAGDPDLGPGHLHRLRQVRHRLPARRDPDQGVRGGRARRRARQLPVQAVQGPRPHRAPADRPGRARRLHRLRRLRRDLPGRQPHRRRAQGDRHDAGRRASSDRAADGATSEVIDLESASGSGLRVDPLPGPHEIRTTRSSTARPCSRCSSSPVPAPAAARRPTSS